MRTQNSATVQDPVTGERTTQVSAQSLNHREDGQWVPIDNALAPTHPATSDRSTTDSWDRWTPTTRECQQGSDPGTTSLVSRGRRGTRPRCRSA